MEQTELLEKTVNTKTACYHCGDQCPDDSINLNEKIFCCNGCKTVFELLDENNLCNYYSIDKNPGATRKYHTKRNYDFLDDHDLKLKLIDFSNDVKTNVTFDIPQMHCSSCIWILENLYNLDSGIISSKVNFLQKKLFITYLEKTTSLKRIVELLDAIGYEPMLNLEDKKEEKTKSEYKSLYYKIGIAGFCFGNIMLLSFPEYLSINVAQHVELKKIFAVLNIILSLPVFFYSSSDYFISAWKGLRKQIVNIDVPLALGILVLFLRSLIDIAFLNGPGFLDSLAGLIFFLLIGKLFQNKTYETLNFERNYKSYFPIAVTVHKGNRETTIPVEKLVVGERIIVRNSELIPADSILIKGNGNIDYSFVTGEAIPVEKKNGEMIYAGGKQVGGAIDIETIKEVSQSYLTQLWNSKAFKKSSVSEESGITSFSNTISKYFTFGVIVLAIAAGIIWSSNLTLAFNAVTAVLIVACPCALALSTPFTLGNTLRIFGKNKLYLKHTHVVEALASIDTIVFDKTGTITENGAANVKFIGKDLSQEEFRFIKSSVRNSTHPLSLAIFNFVQEEKILSSDKYSEQPGKGIEAKFGGTIVRIGSKHFVDEQIADENLSTKVYVSINNEALGYFEITNKYREGLSELISNLEKDYNLALLSGDNEGEKENLRKFFGYDNEFHFRQSPHDKLSFVEELQKNGKKVLMFGDGLNDAGALKQSNIGLSISDDTNNFSPACDGILDSKSFNRIKDFIAFSKTSKKIIVASFILSFVYNVIGLSFAFSGTLSPLIAAVLMPVSSISAVVFTTLSVNISAKKKGLL
ncbi:MAG: heavy metal translocating P-type ATPase metal-binding domain-containing protein [Ignavibacteriales bacterium]|nr:heavy metal translocating P-type ATPase metal-binding domain-containing protein [Ignavibacteriales bacterium]